MILLDLSGSNIADVESASLSKRKGMKSLLNLQTFKLPSCKHLKLSNKWETLFVTCMTQVANQPDTLCIHLDSLQNYCCISKPHRHKNFTKFCDQNALCAIYIMLIRELGRWVVEVQFVGGNGYENGRWVGGMQHTRKTMEKPVATVVIQIHT